MITLSDVLRDDQLLQQYRRTNSEVWSPLILNSKTALRYWPEVEIHFPDYQAILLDPNGVLIGYMNTIPFYWDKSLQELPEEGWDWLIQKGVDDAKNNIKPNTLGGLQVCVSKNFQGQGYSKVLIKMGKEIMLQHKLKHLAIPIRPTLKHQFPDISMEEYMNKKDGAKIFDPWIRVHFNSGAELIKVCQRSMTIDGNLHFWEQVKGEPIPTSNNMLVSGGLNPVQLNHQKDYGRYVEANIWISY